MWPDIQTWDAFWLLSWLYGFIAVITLLGLMLLGATWRSHKDKGSSRQDRPTEAQAGITEAISAPTRRAA